VGLLSETYNPAHSEDLRSTRAVPFDLVVANLYPFEETIKSERVTPEEARANIDIGGPCMIRASAKNFHRVAVVTEPGDYTRILEELQKSEGCTTLKTRFELAQQAFKHTAAYETSITSYLSSCPYETVRGTYTIERIVE
jgi:phosphoribosylaminoimidazolecarboxamide formyltransferase/IMP cyclohydrolase